MKRAQQQRLGRLQRLERIRDVARLEALGKASEAERLFARHAELARRSEELAGAFAHRWEARSGGDLHDLRTFHAGLHTLSQTTSHGSQQAKKAADMEMVEAANAGRRHDRVTDQRKSAERNVLKSKLASELALIPGLARSLNRRR